MIANRNPATSDVASTSNFKNRVYNHLAEAAIIASWQLRPTLLLAIIIESRSENTSLKGATRVKGWELGWVL